MAIGAPLPNSTKASGKAESDRYTYFPAAFGVLTTIFFMWGFLTSLNDILIPHLKTVFGLNYAQAILVQFTFFGAYFLMSIPAGRLVASMGFKKSIVSGLLISAVGAAGFWPAAGLQSYAAFLIAFFVLATGITVLQVAANPYVALLGPARTSSSRLTLAQALNSLGTTLAPLFGGVLILAAVSSSLPASITDAPATRQLVTTIDREAPDQAIAALQEAPPERAAAAITQAATASLQKLPTPAFTHALNRATPAQVSDVFAVLPTDKLLDLLKQQSTARLVAMPAGRLAAALDKLSTTNLHVAQSAELEGFKARIPAAATKQLQAYRNSQAKLVQAPYIGLAVVLLLLAGGVWMFKLPTMTEATGGNDRGQHTFREAWRHPHVRFGVLAIFFYVGAEVSIGSFLVNYLSLPDIGHMTESRAAHYVSLYWGGAMVGRLIGSALMAKISPRKLLSAFAAIAALLVLTTLLTRANVAVVSITAIGLFNSIMFPTIFALAIERLGPLTEKAASLLIMAIVGGAIVPLAQGLLADSIGLQHAFFLPLLCYLYILFYGLSGSRVRNDERLLRLSQ